MHKVDKQLAPQEDDEDDIQARVDMVASTTECTGLIQTPPSSENEAASYTDLYTIPKPVNKKHNGLQHE